MKLINIKNKIRELVLRSRLCNCKNPKHQVRSAGFEPVILSFLIFMNFIHDILYIIDHFSFIQ